MTPEDSQNLADIRAYLAALYEQNASKAKETPSEQTSSGILQALLQASRKLAPTSPASTNNSAKSRKAWKPHKKSTTSVDAPTEPSATSSTSTSSC